MPRPRKPRFLRFDPNVYYFKPRGVPLGSLEEVRLLPEELEALKLSDVDVLGQVEAARAMGISQPTFARILSSARRKIAWALVSGSAIKIEGGDYKMAPRGFGRGTAGRGRMGGPFAAGPVGACVCTNQNCKNEASHQPGVPCLGMKCPKCGSPMVRKS